MPVISRLTDPTRKLTPHARLPLHVHPRMPDTYYTSHSLQHSHVLALLRLGLAWHREPREHGVPKRQSTVSLGEWSPMKETCVGHPMRGHRKGMAEQGTPGM
jgi:hypothetical protein